MSERVTTDDGHTYQVGELLAVGCDAFPDENHMMCTQIGFGTDEVRYLGWHCPRCGKATSSQGHASTGRYIDHEFRKFADDELHFPCDDGFADFPLEDVS